MALCLRNWRPSTVAHPFYPVGLCLHGTAAKSALLVWSDLAITVHIVRDVQDTFMRSLSPANTIVLPLLEADGSLPPTEIHQVLVGTLETCVITTAGQVYHFPTWRTLRPVDDLTGVQCGCVTAHGFAMIRLFTTDDDDEQHPQSIMIYLQTASFEADRQSECVQYDISFERTTLQSTWTDQRWCIKEFPCSPDRPQLFRILRQRPTETYSDGDTLLLFANGSNLLSFLAGETVDDYQVHLVQSFASTVLDFWLNERADALIVQLECGTMELLHVCHLVGIAVRRSQLFFDDHVAAGVLIIGDLCVYATPTEVVQVRIEYEVASDSYAMRTISRTSVYGVVGLTYVPTVKMLLAVTENHMYYTIAWTAGVTDRMVDDARSNEVMLLEVNDVSMAAAKRDLRHVIRMNEQFNWTKAETRKRLNDARLMALIKHVHQRSAVPFQARLSICSRASAAMIDELDNDFVIGRARVTKTTNPSPLSTLGLQIEIHPTIGPASGDTQRTLDFCHNHWTLSIYYTDPIAHTQRMQHIRIHDATMFDNPIEILANIPVDTERLCIPQHFELAFSTTTCVGRDYVCLQFPIGIVGDRLDIRPLFRVNTRPPFVVDGAEAGTFDPPIRSTICLPNDITYDEMIAMFAAGDNIKYEGQKPVYVQLPGRRNCVAFSVGDTGLVHLMAENPFAMNHVRGFVLAEIQRRLGSRFPADGFPVGTLKQIRALRMQCNAIDNEPSASKDELLGQWAEVRDIRHKLRELLESEWHFV